MPHAVTPEPASQSSVQGDIVLPDATPDPEALPETLHNDASSDDDESAPPVLGAEESDKENEDSNTKLEDMFDDSSDEDDIDGFNSSAPEPDSQPLQSM